MLCAITTAQEEPPWSGRGAAGTDLEDFWFETLADDATGGSLLVAYTPGDARIDGQYSALVFSQDSDGRVHLWAVRTSAEAAVLALEQDAGADIDPLLSNNPDFADSVADWLAVHGYPEPGLTLELVASAD